MKQIITRTNKINRPVSSLLILLLVILASCQQETSLKVLQFNIWQEGTMVKGGIQGIVDNIVALEPDLITFSEVRNYDGREFIPILIAELDKRGVTYYGKTSVSTGILSKYKIDKQEVIYPIQDDHGSVLKASAIIQGRTVVVYSAHLDYTHYASYLPRGYSGVTWKKLDAPVLDVDSILQMTFESLRGEAMATLITDAHHEQQQGSLVIIGGDFNEPSHLDWTEGTGNLYDHHGTVVPWECSSMLYANGYLDAYRVAFPDPVTNPGFTYPADNPQADVSKLSWAPEADERERIDFIYFLPDQRLSLRKVTVVGPSGSIVRNQRMGNTSADSIIPSTGTWPTDHKAVLATFVLNF